MNYKDIAIRALKTFVQAFIPVVVSALAAADLTDFSKLKSVAYSALISGAAAGISAVWNFILQLIDKKEDNYTATYAEDLTYEEGTESEDIPIDDEGNEPENGFSC